MNTSYDIAFDTSFLPTTGGFGTYTAQVLKYFIKHDSTRKYLLLENKIPSNIPQYQNQEQNQKTRWQDIPPHWHYLQTERNTRIIWMLRDLPKLIHHYQPHIFLSLDNVTVPKKVDDCKNVLILHDIIPISHPQFCRLQDALLCRWLIRRAIKHADNIITGSQYSGEQIIAHYPQAKQKLTVILDGVEHERFFPAENRESLAAKLVQKYNLFSSKFILTVTTLSPRRNLKRFMHAFAEYVSKRQDHDTCLAIIGCRGWKDEDIYQTVHKLHLQDRIHFLNYVSDEELVLFYQAAYIFANPSLIEGFGLTILEGMACGTPVLCSSTTALGEVAGDAAIQFDPEDTKSITQALMNILQNKSLWNEYSEKGLKHAQHYSWEKTTKQIIQLFNSLL